MAHTPFHKMTITSTNLSHALWTLLPRTLKNIGVCSINAQIEQNIHKRRAYNSTKSSKIQKSNKPNNEK
jgi:hypothetical protein